MLKMLRETDDTHVFYYSLLPSMIVLKTASEVKFLPGETEEERVARGQTGEEMYYYELLL